MCTNGIEQYCRHDVHKTKCLKINRVNTMTTIETISWSKMNKTVLYFVILLLYYSISSYKNRKGNFLSLFAMHTTFVFVVVRKQDSFRKYADQESGPIYFSRSKYQMECWRQHQQDSRHYLKYKLSNSFSQQNKTFGSWRRRRKVMVPFSLIQITTLKVSSFRKKLAFCNFQCQG